MTNITKKPDSDLLIWLAVRVFFALGVMGFDFWYSSYPTMAVAFKWFILMLHAILIILWIVDLLHSKDPNYDIVRKVMPWLSVFIMLLVGINHAVANEDKQVIIDSQQNAVQQKTEDSLYKVKITPKKDSTK